MEDPHLINSDEYLLLQTYCQRRENSDVLKLCGATGDKFSVVAEKLTRIACELPLDDDDNIESDNPSPKPSSSFVTDDPVINKLVELLKKTGDDLDQKIKEDHAFFADLQKAFSYRFFGKLTQAFISTVVPGNQESTCKREQIALTFEVTSRLRAMDLQPMNRIMGYGAQYLQEHFAPWIKQKGGWGRAFGVGDDDDEEVH
ncbi:apoptosis facilitator Bcl-2-like protein 14 [Danio rerio]|uniref:Apoptosis facilitator Bcl-2-like protein 14 n=1 Tax=Danio rerio TaxID=7955 RepID=A0A8M1PS84_DANRE|nr:apoptosis facilitator Bcl-2-like protein 14 [Danio rerio]|eukprot:XP_001337969.2 apoptosis facilitator Bcl-2-like protein 14 [Danio rerio]